MKFISPTPHHTDYWNTRSDAYRDDALSHGGHMDAPEWIPRGGHYGDVPNPLEQEAIVCGFNLRGKDTWMMDPTRNKHIAPIRGGKRKGSGRKAIDADGSVVLTARVTAKQKASFLMAGGAEWLRIQLDLFDPQ